MPYTPTKPAASTPADHAQWVEERMDIKRRLRGDGDRIMGDSRLTVIITWIAGISSVLTASLLLSFFNKFWAMSDSMIKLEANFNAFQRSNDFQISSLDHRVSSVETKVERIESRQVETINRHAGP